MASGAKQRRPTEAHCASVGGVTLLPRYCQSLIAGSSGAAAGFAVAWVGAATAPASASPNVNPQPARTARNFLISSPDAGRSGPAGTATVATDGEPHSTAHRCSHSLTE